MEKNEYSLKYLRENHQKNIRTDLAIESHELYEESDGQGPEGVEICMEGDEEISITKVRVMNQEGAKSLGKPMGNYVTIEVPRLMENDRDLYEDVSRALGTELEKILHLEPKPVVLVVGLGNWKVTPDSLGPKVVEHLLVTRHIKEFLPNQIDDNVNSVCALTPGVLGITGMETGEIIRGVVEKIQPSAVIAIDALASRKMYRVNRTIQIADTGIAPGAGVGNRRMEMNEKTLGVPVIAIGVPTVVDAATIANDTIDMVLHALEEQLPGGKALRQAMSDFDENEKYALMKELLTPYGSDLMVTPKEIDFLIHNIAKIIANGLNMALHPNIHASDIDRFLN